VLLFTPKFWNIYVTKDWKEFLSRADKINGIWVHHASKHSGVTNRIINPAPVQQMAESSLISLEPKVTRLGGYGASGLSTSGAPWQHSMPTVRVPPQSTMSTSGGGGGGGGGGMSQVNSSISTGWGGGILRERNVNNNNSTTSMNSPNIVSPGGVAVSNISVANSRISVTRTGANNNNGTIGDNLSTTRGSAPITPRTTTATITIHPGSVNNGYAIGIGHMNGNGNGNVNGDIPLLPLLHNNEENKRPPTSSSNAGETSPLMTATMLSTVTEGVNSNVSGTLSV
jgi:hypothetical protein